MFKIGDFSRLSQISIKTLRYYDAIGLLKPAYTDDTTNYRYYSAEQLPHLNRILALKDLGLSLEQIREWLNAEVSPDQMSAMLREKHAELQRQVQAEQQRLARVAARLRQIEHEGTLPAHEVVIKSIPAQRIAAVRAVVPTFAGVSPLFDALLGFLEDNHFDQASAYPCLMLYHDEGYRAHDVDLTVAAAINRDMASTATVQVYNLPAVEMLLSVMHRGPYDTLMDAYTALINFIDANGYRVCGPNRELYLHSPCQHTDPATYVTEIQFPVVPTTAPARTAFAPAQS